MSTSVIIPKTVTGIRERILSVIGQCKKEHAGNIAYYLISNEGRRPETAEVMELRDEIQPILTELADSKLIKARKYSGLLYYSTAPVIAGLTDEQVAAKQANKEAAKNIYSDLPKIVYFVGVHDCGPCEDGCGSGACPHCGADGRWIWEFVCDDGTTRGAMRGCLKKFKHHPFAAHSLRIAEKVEKCRANGWELASWDKIIMEAIEKFAAGEMAERDAKIKIDSADSDRKRYLRNRFGGR